MDELCADETTPDIDEQSSNADVSVDAETHSDDEMRVTESDIATNKVVYFFSANLAMFGFLLLIGSLATPYWLQSEVRRNITQDRSIIGRFPDLTHKCDRGQLLGSIYFGLFYGKQCLNHGFGVRVVDFDARYILTNMFGMEIGIAMILCSIVAIVNGVVAMTLSLRYIIYKPCKDAVARTRTLLAVNTLSLLLVSAVIGCFFYKFFGTFSDGFINSEHAESHWITQRVFVGYSYVLVFGCALMDIINIALLSMKWCFHVCRARQKQRQLERRNKERQSGRGRLRAFTKDSLTELAYGTSYWNTLGPRDT